MIIVSCKVNPNRNAPVTGTPPHYPFSMKYAHQALFPIVTRTIHESDLTTVFWQTICRTSIQFLCIFHGVVKINELKKQKSQHLL
jgi:hypothetical protein